MNRRDTLKALVALGAAEPLAVCGQSLRRVVLFLPKGGSRESFVGVFRNGMRDLGWIEGRDIALEVHWTDDDSAESEAEARRIVASNPDIIVAPGGATAMPLRRIGATIPVVFAYSGDPVDAGLVSSFNAPGANFTGITWMSLSLVGKRLEFLRDMRPRLRRVAVFGDPRHAGEPKERAATKAAADALGLELHHYPVRSPGELREAMDSARRERCETLDVYPDGFTLRNRMPIADFAMNERMPSISGWVDYAEAGFLASYGTNRTETIRRLAWYAHRVLRGTKPSDLPVELPAVVECVVNARTAATIGLSIPPAVLARADRVIE